MLLKSNSAIVPELSIELENEICNIRNEACLNELLLLASKANSIKEIQNVLNSYANQ